MEYTVQALASLAGVSARTLRYYDQIGLLCPQRSAENGYRLYGPAEVDTLQQILFYRELGLSLDEIESLLHGKNATRLDALRGCYERLQSQRDHLNRLLGNLAATIVAEEGGTQMSDQEKFACFKKEMINKNEQDYGTEIRTRYGDDTVEASNAKFAAMTQEQYQQMQTCADQIGALLAQAMREHADPAGELGQQVATLHRDWLGFTWPKYAPEAHAGLAALYLADERFTAYYDQYAPGSAVFLHDAISAMVGKQAQ